MARTKKTEIKMITCSACDKQKRESDYYSSNSPFHKATGRIHVCKKCIWDEVKEDDLDSWKDVLRRLDKPFLIDLYESSKREADKLNRSLFGTYMKNVVMHQNRNLTWADSSSSMKKELNLLSNDEKEEESEIIKKWGRGYKPNEIEFLENFYSEYENSYATDTPAQVNLYKNIAKVHLQAEKELANNETKAFKDLMELSSKLHNDGNIKPIQSTGANDDKGLSTYGLWIKEIENNEPCEVFDKQSEYEDYNGFKKYIDNWFVRPFKNIFNVSKDFNVKEDDD